MKTTKSTRITPRLAFVVFIFAAIASIFTVTLATSSVFAQDASDSKAVVAQASRVEPGDENYAPLPGSSHASPEPENSILPNDMDTIDLLVMAIWIMTAGIGVVAVGGIVYGAILYTTAGGSQEKTRKGIEIIRNVVIGLLLYVFMFAIINFLIPGRVIT